MVQPYGPARNLPPMKICWDGCQPDPDGSWKPADYSWWTAPPTPQLHIPSLAS